MDWLALTKNLTWYKQPTKAFSGIFSKPRWFEDGKLNVAQNCLRHDGTALIWISDDTSITKKISYSELKQRVARFATILQQHNIAKGDRVAIYMPMIPEAVIAMLACAYIGAVHTVVFGGFSLESLKERIADANAKLVIAANGRRKGKELKLYDCAKQTGTPTLNPTTVNWNVALAKPVIMDAEDPLFILYTSGSTGKPKGLVHTCAGYAIWASYTIQNVFNLKTGDRFFCTADIGWITGHSYVVYGPLLNGYTTIIHEGVAFHPDHQVHWRICNEHNVAAYYTAPTAIRELMRHGMPKIKPKVHILGSVGEPLNPAAYHWYQQLGNCAVMDTWWQTETGGIMLAPIHGAPPGFTGSPLPGIKPQLHEEIDGKGALCISEPWPGQARTIYQDHERYMKTYFPNNIYFSGDQALLQDGKIRILGRLDDVVNVAGHRIGTAELEAAITTHPLIIEAAAIDIHDAITGQAIHVFCVATGDVSAMVLRDIVAKKIGKFARPKHITFVLNLPKTRSGKVMRRLLRQLATNSPIGDVSTLAEPAVLEQIKKILQ